MKKSIFVVAITALVAGTSITSCDSSTKKVEDAAVKVDQASEDLTDAVSYTHLDVYKRQGESDANTLGKELVVISDVIPVSYTHLDVYKRQTYFYVIDLGDGSKVIKGTIYLNR